MEKTVGFIGAGNMATAIINGLLKNNVAPANKINVFDISKKQLELMAEKGINTFANRVIIPVRNPLNKCDINLIIIFL